MPACRHGQLKASGRDESRTDGKAQWQHVLSTPWLVCNRTSDWRVSLLELPCQRLRDPLKPYFTIPSKPHSTWLRRDAQLAGIAVDLAHPPRT